MWAERILYGGVRATRRRFQSPSDSSMRDLLIEQHKGIVGSHFHSWVPRATPIPRRHGDLRKQSGSPLSRSRAILVRPDFPGMEMDAASLLRGPHVYSAQRYHHNLIRVLRHRQQPELAAASSAPNSSRRDHPRHSNVETNKASRPSPPTAPTQVRVRVDPIQIARDNRSLRPMTRADLEGRTESAGRQNERNGFRVHDSDTHVPP